MISIIIPHHKETLDVMNGCLSSLDIQAGIDFEKDMEIIIVNDDKDGMITDFSKYTNIKFRIRQFFNDKAGYMGVSRQIGIDNARGEYLLFIDSDDMFTLPMLLCDLLSRTRVFPNKDVFCFKFYEESIAGDCSYRYLDHEHDFIWMFAKLYKKEFIVNNNIRFHNDILWHEDTYFNQVLLACNPDVDYVDYFAYLWHCTPESITRKNSAEYGYSSLCMYIDAHDKLLDRIRLLVTGQQVLQKAIWLIVYIYCSLQKNTQTNFRERYRNDIECQLAEFAKKWDKDNSAISVAMLPYIAEIIQAQCNNVFLPQEGFEQFVKRIRKTGD